MLRSRSAQSDRDLKECRETQYWLEVLLEEASFGKKPSPQKCRSEIVKPEKFQPLLDEANEIGKILTASTKTMKEKQ
ncbi:MAG: hypothetical protein ACRCZS_06700 [Chroococcidiopsis sp.]